MVIKMKATAKILALIWVLIMLLALAACGGETTGGSGAGLPENSPPAQSEAVTTQPPAPSETATTPPPTPSQSLPSPEPADPADVSETPASPAPTLLTYDEATAICSAWLDKHADLSPSYAIHDWGYSPGEIPPPTYFLFGEPYYEFYVSSDWDYDLDWDRRSGYSHLILVHAETGELLSLFMMKSAGERLTAIVEPLDDWYNTESDAYPPARLTADEAIAIYEAWVDDRDEHSYYRLNRQSYDEYVIFGEQYYHFHAEDDDRYWYNILVHTETGELLYMLTSDGMFPETSIEPLDDWYDRWQ